MTLPADGERPADEIKPQRQDSLHSQLQTVKRLAEIDGCYDAADFIARHLVGNPALLAASPGSSGDDQLTPRHAEALVNAGEVWVKHLPGPIQPDLAEAFEILRRLAGGEMARRDTEGGK